MQLLIAHGDAASRLALKLVAAALPGGDLEVIESGEGMETLEMLLATDSPVVALVDWELPGCEGPELCRLVRAYREAGLPYIILLAPSDYRLAEGLEAGADDCVRTPADADELRARINVGRRFAALPWERITQAAAGDARCAGDHDPYPTLELVAQCSPEDDGLDGAAAASSATIELESVLVAR